MTKMTAETAVDMTDEQRRERGIFVREFERKAFLAALPAFIAIGTYTPARCVTLAWNVAFESLAKLPTR